MIIIIIIVMIIVIIVIMIINIAIITVTKTLTVTMTSITIIITTATISIINSDHCTIYIVHIRSTGCSGPSWRRWTGRLRGRPRTRRGGRCGTSTSATGAGWAR